MEVNSYFTDFLAAIRPTTDQIEKMKSKHEELRESLKNDPILGPLIISTFIQGSYRRYTACLLYTSPSPRDRQKSRMPSSA